MALQRLGGARALQPPREAKQTELRRANASDRTRADPCAHRPASESSANLFLSSAPKTLCPTFLFRFNHNPNTYSLNHSSGGQAGLAVRLHFENYHGNAVRPLVRQSNPYERGEAAVTQTPGY